jgi:hypothetical protein
MSRQSRRWIANLALTIVAATSCLLLRFPPETSGFYPRCPVFTWLHIYCPGCGGTRAMAALLHGRVNEAIHWNVFAVVLLPFALIFFAVSYWRALRQAEFQWPSVPDVVCKLVFVLIGVFTVARNLPAR